VVAGIDLSSPYLTRGLIAYIGNKRSLLPFLSASFSRCASAVSTSHPLRFLDPFAGSGGVSRLGRALGFAVFSNDREYYAAIIARCRVVMDHSRLEAAFACEGGSAKAFESLDAFARGDSPFNAEPYIARHYAPKDTETADWRSERLFYTAENARYIDRAREAIELRYPIDPLDPAVDETKADAKAALLDSLLYEAATRVNTSGVFKACHRGFGGHGGDALTRIMAPIRLSPPDLVSGPAAIAAARDAAAFCAAHSGKHSADIVYIDPPYNQHQYGSNYHLLTTIARWDKPPIPDDRDQSGFLSDRSGIRADWVATRSDFCRRGRAAPAFASLLDSIDSRFILVSYNDGGIVPLEELRDILEARGKLRIEAVPYVAYRGGKQSATRTERTSELLFVLDTSGTARSSVNMTATGELRRIRAFGALEALKKERFAPRRMVDSPSLGSSVNKLIGPDGRLLLNGIDPDSLSLDRLESVIAALQRRACAGNMEAFDVVYDLLRGAIENRGERKKRELERLGRDALALLKKIAFRKYANEYGPRSLLLRSVLETLSSARLIDSLDALDGRAALRGVAPPSMTQDRCGRLISSAASR